MNPNQVRSGRIHHKCEEGHSLDTYKRDKLFPHINDQYDFRINNRILIAKIINPRRDKIIIESLANASPKYHLKRKRHEPVPSTLHLKRRNQTPQDTAFRGRASPLQPQDENCAQRNTSKTKNRQHTIKEHLLEEQNRVQSNRRETDKEELHNTNMSKTTESSLRNNFIGKIVHNASRGKSAQLEELSQNAGGSIHCDMTVSYYSNSGLICKNTWKQPFQGRKAPKIRRVIRPAGQQYGHNQQSYSLRVEEVSTA